MQQDQKYKEKRSLLRWISYDALVQQMPFFLYLTALAVVYIYNGHHSDKLSRDINRTARELKELKFEYKTIKGEVLFRSKQSELVKVVEPIGLKEMTRPAVVLADNKKNK